jgi:hypothetical protein
MKTARQDLTALLVGDGKIRNEASLQRRPPGIQFRRRECTDASIAIE